MLNPKTHIYTDLKGREFKSVTTILKEEGIIKAFYTNEELRQMGSDLHLMTLAKDLGKRIVEAPEEYIIRLNNYVRFKKETGFEPEFCEHEMISAVLGVAGTADRFGRMHGERWCIDFKFTVGSGMPWHEHQTGGYCALASTDDKAQLYAGAKRAALIIRPDRYIFIPHTKIRDAVRKFTAICIAHHAKREAGVLYEQQLEEDQW